MDSMASGEKPSEVKKEERRSDRVELNVSVAYSHDVLSPTQQKSPHFRWGTMIDINERGLSLRAPDKFFVQRVIALQLKLSDQSRGIKMLGKVVWAAEEDDGNMRAGVQFIGTLPSDWRDLIGQTRHAR